MASETGAGPMPSVPALPDQPPRRPLTAAAAAIRGAPWGWWLSAAALPLLLLVPVVGLDPARGVTFSNAPFSDEAWNLVGARNLALFGHPTTDGWRTWLLTIPFTLLQAAAMAVFGVRLEVARLVMIAAVVLTAGGVAVVLTRAVGAPRAWLAAIAFATSALILYYGRLAFLEPLVGAFLAAGVLSIGLARSARPVLWGALGGAALALAVMTKAVAGPSAVAVVLVVLLTARRLQWSRRWLLGAIPVAGAAAAAWFGLVLWPHRRAVEIIVTVVYPPFTPPTGLRSAIHRLIALPFADGALPLAWPLLLLALAGTLVVLAGARRSGWAQEDGLLVTPFAGLAALAAAVLALGLVDYQPNRYVVAFLPLAAILAAWSIPPSLLARTTRPAVLVGIVAVVAAIPGLALDAGWVRNAGREVAPMQAAALQALPAGASVAGQYAPLVALGAKVKTIVPFESVNGGDLYAKGVRYLAWTDAGPGWMGKHPAAWAGRTVIACMTWGRSSTRICLYALPDTP